MPFTKRVQALIDKDVAEGRMYPVEEEDIVPGVYLLLPDHDDKLHLYAVSIGFFRFAIAMNLCPYRIVGRQMYLGKVPTKYVETSNTKEDG